MNWETTTQEFYLIGKIVDRVSGLLKGNPSIRMTLGMDLIACHANGCGLDLERLSEAQDMDLLHDALGIARHINRKTGELQDCFLPRFAAVCHQ
ncbi:MAG: hypothetical protein HGB04_06605 [Chlorobiaceae bacterium]|nr:hypothetical protein [Chlorobiaceae bacterium]